MLLRRLRTNWFAITACVAIIAAVAVISWATLLPLYASQAPAPPPTPIFGQAASNGNLRPTSTTLQQAGVYYFTMSIVPPSHIWIALYDQQKRHFATVQGVKEDKVKPGSGITAFEIVPLDGVSEWLRVDHQESVNGQRATLTTSTGTTVHMDINIAQKRGDKKPRVLGVTVAINGETPQILSSPRDLETIYLNRIVTTNSLKLLRTVVADLQMLRKRSLNQKHLHKMVYPLEDGLSCYIDGGGDCQVHCVKLIVGLPVFWCDGGEFHNPTTNMCCPTEGFWWVYSCDTVFCDVPCADFNVA